MTEQDRMTIQKAIELLESAHVSTALVWPRYDCTEALRKMLAEQPQQEPDKWVLREVMFDEDGIPMVHREPQQSVFTPKLTSPKCWCMDCDLKANGGLRSRMSLCPDCGNKRCPKATNHQMYCANMEKEPQQEPIPFSGADENPPVFGRRWRLADDGFGLQRDDDGPYVHIDDAMSVLHAALTGKSRQEQQEPIVVASDTFRANMLRIAPELSHSDIDYLASIAISKE